MLRSNCQLPASLCQLIHLRPAELQQCRTLSTGFKVCHPLWWWHHSLEDFSFGGSTSIPANKREIPFSIHTSIHWLGVLHLSPPFPLIKVGRLKYSWWRPFHAVELRGRFSRFEFGAPKFHLCGWQGGTLNLTLTQPQFYFNISALTWSWGDPFWLALPLVLLVLQWSSTHCRLRIWHTGPLLHMKRWRALIYESVFKKLATSR